MIQDKKTGLIMGVIRYRAWLILLLPALLICLLWQRGSTTTIDLGIPGDQDILHGFYEREKNPGYTYRWSQPTALLQLPRSYFPGIIGFQGTAPNGARVSLSLGNQAHVVLPPSDTVFLRHYTLLAPALPDMWGWASIGITAQQSTARIEERPLGLLVDNLLLAAVRPLSLPPLVILGILGLLPVVVTLLFRLADLTEWWSIFLGLLAGLVAVGIWHARPLWVQQYLPMWLPVLGIFGGLLLWMRRASTRLQDAPVVGMLIVFVVTAGLIPLYLLLKYGLLTMFHWHNLPVLAMLAALPLPFTSSRTRRLLTALVVIAVIGYALFNFYDAVRVDYATDFKPLFRGPRSVLNGGNLYDLDEIHANHLGTTYKYPPFFVLVMGPLTNLSFSAAIHSWRAFNTLLIVASGWMLWRWSKRPLRSWSTLALIYMLLAFQQLADTLGYAQVDIIVLVGLAAALCALRYQRWALWGACLAIPTAIKLYPAYLIVHAVASRRWQSFLAFLITLGTLTGLSILIIGLDVHVTYVRDVLPMIGGGTAWTENQTLNGFLNRLLATSIRLEPEPSGTVPFLTYLGAVLVTGLTWFRVQRLTSSAGFGLWIVTMLMLLPAAWIHYQVLLLIPFYQAFVRLDRAPDRFSWHSLFCYGLAWFLLCYGNQWTFFDGMFHGPIWALILSYKFYGLLLLWWGIARDRTAQAVHSDIGTEERRIPVMIAKHG